MSLLISKFSSAAHYATERHEGQFRDDGVTPYINHPFAVAKILHNEAGIDDRDTLVAALLHDTIEDTGDTHADLAAKFGAVVADTVQELTNDGTLPKAHQKQAQIDKAPHYSKRAALIKIADKTANLRDIIAAPPLWPPQRKRAYYDHARSVVQAMGPRHPKLDLIFEKTYRAGISQL